MIGGRRKTKRSSKRILTKRRLTKRRTYKTKKMRGGFEWIGNNISFGEDDRNDVGPLYTAIANQNTQANNGVPNYNIILGRVYDQISQAHAHNAAMQVPAPYYHQTMRAEMQKFANARPSGIQSLRTLLSSSSNREL